MWFAGVEARVWFLIGGAHSCHEVEDDGAEKKQKKSSYHIGCNPNTFIIPRMIETKGLQHAPESMAEMHRQNAEGEEIKQSVEKISQ